MSAAERLRWRVARLRAMSPGEVVWRLRVARTKTGWRRQGLPRPQVPNRAALEAAAEVPFFGLPASGPLSVPGAAGTEVAALLREADAALEGRWLFFAFAEEPPPATPDGLTDWHRCDATGVRSDPGAFGPDIDYRDAALVGDYKYIWEKSRHHHTTVLALAYALTGEDRYARAAARQIGHWIGHNPPLRGLNWTSALELGVRLISWAWCFHLLRGHPVWEDMFGPESVFWPTVYQHQTFLSRYASLGSSANNHLLGELAGQYVASVTWPLFPESEGWRRGAKAALEREAGLQFFSSGVNREMGFDYHLFATELLLLPALLGEGRGDAFSDAYRGRLRAAVEAVHLLLDAGGNRPRYGDSDEGLAVQLQARSARREDWLLRVGRTFLGAAVPEPEGGRLMAHLLVPPESPSHAPTPRQEEGSFAFTDAGLYSLAHRRSTPQEVLVLADAGPLGYLSLAGHGHADALAFTLSVGGQPVLVDPGTYLYLVDPAWRGYFRSTAAHNTLEVDGQDQSVQAGGFLWSHKARTQVHAWEPRADGGRLVASHDGYMRLPGRVTHRRSFELRGQTLDLTDGLEGSGEHEARLHFHFHPHCELREESAHVWRAEWPGGALRLTFDVRCSLHLGRGEEAPPLGWSSPIYGVKVPSPSLRAGVSAPLPLTLRTTLEVL